ncbi:MAG: hypothetical protein MJ090_02725 [Clostridia bacterium]|nr:hypothetical protein [Clostridia bacterium]
MEKLKSEEKTMSYPFVKLNRYITEDEIFKNEKALKFYIWLLCKATYEESDIMVGYQKVHLSKGEVVVGVKGLGEKLGISYQNLRSIIKYLKSAGKIASRSTSKFTVITLLDKEIFSRTPISSNPQIGKQSNEQTNDNKEYLDINKLRRMLFASLPPKQNQKQTRKYNYGGYDLELYEKMLNSDGFG